MTAKRVMDIEAVLRWTYRDELPKAVPDAGIGGPRLGNGWDSVETCLELLAVIDTNRYGVVPDLYAVSDPHTDALRVFEEVKRLDDLVVEFPEDWHLAAGLGDLGAEGESAIAQVLERLTMIDEAKLRRLRRTPRSLIERYALLGGCPDWEMEPPVRRPAVGPNGKPVWLMRRTIVEPTFGGGQVERVVLVDGYNSRRGRPFSGAFQKFVLDPDPVPGLIERMEYEVWRAALDVLAATLNGVLESVDVRPSPRPHCPWVPSAA